MRAIFKFLAALATSAAFISCAGESRIDSKMEEIAGEYILSTASISGTSLPLYLLTDEQKSASITKQKHGWYFVFKMPGRDESGNPFVYSSSKQEITWDPLLDEYLFILPTKGTVMTYNLESTRILIKGNPHVSWIKKK